MTIYTYTVDHGDETPIVNSDTEVNGGKIQSVMFDDALLKLERVEELIEEILCRTECEGTRDLIDEFNKSGGAAL